MRASAGDAAIRVSGLSPTSTIYEIKTQYAAQTGQAVEKTKLLLNKKPAGDLKTLKELGVEGENVEFSVMVMGGASATSTTTTTPVVEKSESAATAALTVATSAAEKMDIDPPSASAGPESEVAQAAAGPPAAEHVAGGELQTDAFWTDLQGFLAQRLRDEKEGERLAKLFRETAGR
nr:hypothetical protein CFP56_60734 [Quercus suber]